jgi:hypothetical protein
MRDALLRAPDALSFLKTAAADNRLLIEATRNMIERRGAVFDSATVHVNTLTA